MGFSTLLCFLASLQLAHVSLASPSSASPDVILVGRDITSFSSDGNITILNADAIHANVMRNWPAERIISAKDIEEKLAIGSEQGLMYYVNDTQSWVTITPPSDEKYREGSISARQQCSAYEDRKVNFGHEFWGPWHAASPCLLSDVGSGGSVSYGVTDTLAIAVGGG
jgi:hypothetical protein